MHRLLMALAVAVLAAAPAAASDQTDVMVVVRQFTDAFNKGDTTAAPAACTDEMSIIDEFPPYEWHGARACLRWMYDYVDDANKNEITDGLVTLGSPRHVDVSADRAYVVIPSNYAYKRNGKPVKQIGSMFTVVLVKLEAGWRITAWSWARR